MAQRSTAVGKFFEEKQPKDIDELIKILHDCDTATIQIVADASRIEKWRPSLRRAIVKLNLLSQLKSSPDPALARQILRLTGNLCIDDLPTKDEVGKYLGEISECLQTVDNFDVAAGVVTNIFTDNPDAPAGLAIQLGIPDRLAKGLAQDRLLDVESPISEAIVFFLVNIIQSSLKDSIECASIQFVYSMLLIPTLNWDDELLDETLAAVVALLSNNNVQSQIALCHSNLLLGAAEDISEKIMAQVRAESPLWAFITLYQAEAARYAEVVDDGAALLQSLHALQNVAGDMASCLAYQGAKEMKNDPIMEYFQAVTTEDCLISKSLESSLAFLFLGNIARNAETCVKLVRTFDFHERAIQLIGAVGKSYPEARYLAVGFLCNLINAEQNKAIVSVSKPIKQLMEPTWSEGLNDGLRLLRALVRKSPKHCMWLLDIPSAECPDCLVRMSHFENWLPTMTPTNTIEIARLVVIVLRTLQLDRSLSTSNISPDTFMTQAFTNSLLTLTEQGTRSPLSSEGILGLALASQTPASAQLVLNALRGNGNLKRFLNALEDNSNGAASSENLENALVVFAKVKEHCPGETLDGEVQKQMRELTARIQQNTQT